MLLLLLLVVAFEIYLKPYTFFFGTCNNLWQQFMKNFKQLCGCSRSVHRKYEQVEARTGIAQELPLDTIYVVKYRQLG